MWLKALLQWLDRRVQIAEERGRKNTERGRSAVQWHSGIPRSPRGICRRSEHRCCAAV